MVPPGRAGRLAPRPDRIGCGDFLTRGSGALFAARAVMEVTVPREALCSNCKRGWGSGVSEMSYHQRPHELRLAISSEAEALISDFGGNAYVEACRRASEASSDSLARDWSVVAATIARRSGRRSSVLDALFG
jgi:hypothetical protein